MQDEVAHLQDEIERRGAGFYIPLAKEVFNSTESINAITETLGAMTTATGAKDADAIPATVGRNAGNAPEQDISKSIR